MPNRPRTIMFAVIGAIALASAVATRFSQSVFGDDRLPGVVVAAGFGLLWLVNLWLNVKYYGTVGSIRREESPATYWGCFLILLLIGVFGIGVAVALLVHDARPPK